MVVYSPYFSSVNYFIINLILLENGLSPFLNTVITIT